MTVPTPSAPVAPAPVAPAATATTPQGLPVLVPIHLSPTQTRHPWKATLRTALAGIIGAATVIPEIIAVAHPSSGELAAIGGQAVAVSALITRIIAIPRINALLTKIGLGAEPKV